MKTLSFNEKLQIIETLKSLKERYNSLFKLEDAIANLRRDIYSPKHPGFKQPAYFTHIFQTFLTDPAFAPDEKLNLFEALLSVLENAAEQQRLSLQRKLDRIQIQIVEPDELSQDQLQGDTKC